MLKLDYNERLNKVIESKKVISFNINTNITNLKVDFYGDENINNFND